MFKFVEHYGGPDGYQDRDGLDGRELSINGEKCRAHFPDGTITEVDVLIGLGKSSYSDMGRHNERPMHRAYIWIKHHGANVRAPLRDSGISLERM